MISVREVDTPFWAATVCRCMDVGDLNGQVLYVFAPSENVPRPSTVGEIYYFEKENPTKMQSRMAFDGVLYCREMPLQYNAITALYCTVHGVSEVCFFNAHRESIFPICNSWSSERKG